MKQSRTPHSRFPSVHLEQGQAMAEFLIVLPVLILLILGTIQVALLFHAKITLNYATFEAARSGSLENADFTAIKNGFARGMAPAKSYAADNSHHSQVKAFKSARQDILALFDDTAKLIRIERLNPTQNSFNQHAVDGVIPNDNLLFRSANGTADKTLQDANLLHLRITYWHEMEVPIVSTLIHNFICCDTTVNEPENSRIAWQDDQERKGCRWQGDPACARGLRFPLTSVAVMRMQTPIHNSSGFYSVGTH